MVCRESWSDAADFFAGKPCSHSADGSRAAHLWEILWFAARAGLMPPASSRASLAPTVQKLQSSTLVGARLARERALGFSAVLRE